MKILITGGAGYIGVELIYKLDNIDGIEEIVVYDNLSRENFNLFIGVQKIKNKIRFVKGDILDSINLQKEVNKADIVVHLAAKVTVPFMDTNLHEFEQVNNWGTSEVVYAVENSNVKKLIFMSTVSVYGANNQNVNSVNDQLNPLTYYGISKQRAEEHVQRLKNKKEIFILRCGNVYGYSKTMRFDSVINRFMFEANYSNKIAIKGDGTQMRTFIHINSVSDSLVKIIAENIEPGTYNLTESNWSLLDVVDKVRTIYPEMEMIFLNKHFPIKSISVASDDRLPWLIEGNLEKELGDFKENFTF